ncbi:MAG TPA: ABC transporter permease [Thermoanaerobaculia bacterium]|nr:ABC transporter permease [Thermoanaerobaculia bacterium]
MPDFWQESRQALRSLRRSPRAALVILLTLAVGTGANLAIFGVVRATLLDPLPFRAPDRLVSMTWELGDKRQPVSPAELSDLRRQSRTLDAIGAYHIWTFNVGGIDRPERIPGAVVTANLFSVLGVEPARGHGFTADGPEAPAEVLLSDGLWHRRFGADPTVVGRKLVLDDTPVTVAGVMPPDFRFPVTRPADLWKLSPHTDQMPRDMRFYLVIGRLAAGAQTADAEAELKLFGQTLEREYPGLNKGLAAKVLSLRDTVVQDFERNLLLLQLVVAAALVLACFNVAMLQLGRAEERRGEVAVRYALGAGRLRIFRQALWESLWLGLGGGLLGALIARLGVGLLIRFGPVSIHRLDQARVGGAELLLAVLLGAGCGLLIGQIPALIHTRRSLSETLRPGLRMGSGQAVRRALVAVQVAVSLVLLVACGLFLRSLERLSSVALGFDPDPVVTTGVSLPGEFQEPEKLNAFFGELRRRLEAIPGVDKAATAVTPPLVRGFVVTHEFALVGQERSGDAAPTTAAIRPVSPGFFELLEIPVRRGRAFRDADDHRAEPVAVVNESFARQFTGGEGGALDRRVAIDLDYGATVGRLPHPEWRIVGVVGDVQQADLENAEVPAVYVSTLQAPWMETRILARTAGVAPEAVAPQVERAVREMVPLLPVLPVLPLRAAADELLAPVRFQSGLLGTFAALALALMSIGLYGTLAYSVSRRAREIGLRVALGAGRWETRWLVMRQALWIVLAGLVLGLFASFWFGRVLASLLFGVRAADPATYAAVVVLMLLTTLLACWLPARRATAIDPAVSLRND